LRPVRPVRQRSESSVRSVDMSTSPAPVASIMSIILGFDSVVVFFKRYKVNEISKEEMKKELILLEDQEQMDLRPCLEWRLQRHDHRILDTLIRMIRSQSLSWALDH